MKTCGLLFSTILFSIFGIGDVKAETNALPPLKAALSQPGTDDGRHLSIEWGEWKDQEKDAAS